MDPFFGFSLEIRNRWTFDRTLLTLTGFITTLATLAAWPVTRDSRLFYFLMLAMYSGQIGSFSSRDLLLFFIMWELELIPRESYLKWEAYGLVRINMEPQPHAHFRFSPWLIIMGTIQIIYAASTSLGQRISSITDTGLNGAILQIISHGFFGAALFFLAGTSYDRIRLVYLDEMGGITIPMPKIFTLFSSFSLASLALPGMSGFIAE
ncbi:hypothetical protein Cgig2_032367 (chloroplast) [Carnegiea gigantea]|uniref:NADH:quinone oxidoreductase/Mrp antiporter transmembrane domain-containing protein n=1 Tax=Carnegiea gigantea TaxID=171969 RepID=A0A9Q1GIE5_9CARY|nr:hypothetical protein Cgig2_032367 [Carnegiea gigantea]